MSATLASAPSMTAARQPRASLGPFAAVQAWFRRLEAERELSALTDRELNDIGLSRGQIRDAVRGIGPFDMAVAYRSV